MDALSIATSGIQSAQRRLAGSAHNVANLTTPGFRPLRTLQSSQAGGGSTAILRQTDEPEPVQLSHEALEQTRARMQAQAMLGVVHVVDSTRGCLIDILA
ncbi:MAG: flagellar basal body rod protein [Myxococcota bacterium]